MSILLAAGSLLGCNGSNAEAPVEAPQTVIDLSTGTVDPKLLGAWKNPKESYAFAADGTFKMHFDRMERTGPSPSNTARKVGDLSGKWSVSGDYLMLAVEKGERNTKHKMILLVRDGGKTMELRPTFLKHGPGTVYKHEK